LEKLEDERKVPRRAERVSACECIFVCWQHHFHFFLDEIQKWMVAVSKHALEQDFIVADPMFFFFTYGTFIAGFGCMV
jgi:hypothetical protein